MNKKIRTFFMFHIISIVLFAIIYYILMMNIEEHFIMNGNLPNNILNYKILDCVLLSAGIETTNGFTNLLPSSYYSNCVILIQYLITIVITGYLLI